MIRTEAVTEIALRFYSFNLRHHRHLHFPGRGRAGQSRERSPARPTGTAGSSNTTNPKRHGAHRCQVHDLERLGETAARAAAAAAAATLSQDASELAQHGQQRHVGLASTRRCAHQLHRAPPCIRPHTPVVSLHPPPRVCGMASELGPPHGVIIIMIIIISGVYRRVAPDFRRTRRRRGRRPTAGG
jgi:hypothetical protein